MSKRFLYLGESFDFKWLKKIGFYKLLYKSIRFSEFVTWNDVDGFSLGMTSPYEILWRRGYTCFLGGWVFWKPLIYYKKG